MLRVGISGCGAVARLYHLPALAALSEEGALEVIAAFDPNASQARALLEAFPNARATSSFDDLLKQDLDLVILASPPSFHADQIIDAAEAGIAILCEKPLALTYEDGERAVRAAREAGTLLSVGMVRRHLASVKFIRELLRNKAIGRVQSTDIFEGGFFDWPVHSAAYFDRDAGGVGVLGDIGTHVLDLLRWWFGEPRSIEYRDDAHGGIEANCDIKFSFDEFNAHVRLSRDWPQPNRYLFRGEGGWLNWLIADERVEFGFENVALVAGLTIGSELRAPSGEPRLGKASDGFEQAFEAQLRSVLRAVEGAVDAELVTGEDALKTLMLVEQCQSARQAMPMQWFA